MEIEKITRYVYIVFVVIAVVMGLVVGYMAYNSGWNDPNVKDINGWVTLLMLILGIITGLTSITEKEVTPFLMATIALLVAAATDVWSPLGNIHDLLYCWATAILNYIVAFAAPAAVITAVKSMLPIVKEK
ncbi:MAG: hypothetical protein QW270_08300 [Candidatus Bathyarchaeia archaeon]